jgi:DNA helicase-2/ATP-dependent DNA helicase PcrA
MDWVAIAENTADAIIANDPRLKKFVNDRKAELDRAREDYEILLKAVEKHRWRLDDPYEPDRMSRVLYAASGLSDLVKKQISSSYFDKLAKERIRTGKPLSLLYVLKRFTSIDWNLLDLFYKLCTFEHLKKMFDVAERQGDEGPVANLGLITQYLSLFVDDRVPLITADLLVEKILQVVFFSYLFALYRLGETELENAEDPFPKGRIPFLTIHQSKGLEFPVIVLGNTSKIDRGPSALEQITRPLLSRVPGEPLEKMSKFDIMRMFYVALSRAKNLLIIAHYKGVGQRMNDEFKTLLTDDFPRIPKLDISKIPAAQAKDETLPKAYSFTSDFLMYKRCPRQYMIFRKFDFVPSRSQTMFFGNLVHRTLEDLHHELIRRRTQS